MALLVDARKADDIVVEAVMRLKARKVAEQNARQPDQEPWARTRAWCRGALWRDVVSAGYSGAHGDVRVELTTGRRNRPRPGLSKPLRAAAKTWARDGDAKLPDAAAHELGCY